jgi:hypothetical protein
VLLQVDRLVFTRRHRHSACQIGQARYALAGTQGLPERILLEVVGILRRRPPHPSGTRSIRAEVLAREVEDARVAHDNAVEDSREALMSAQRFENMMERLEALADGSAPVRRSIFDAAIQTVRACVSAPDPVQRCLLDALADQLSAIAALDHGE